MGDLLLFRLGGLGDLLVVLPSIALARLTRRTGRLTLVCRAEYGILLREAGLVHALVDVASREAAHFFAAAPSWTAGEKSELARYDGIFAWLQKASVFPPVAAARSAGVATARAISPPAGLQVPLSRFFFDVTATLLGYSAAAPPSFEVFSRLPVGAERRQAALRDFDLHDAGGVGVRYAVIHPGSGSPSKCWPLSGFISVAERLSSAGMRGVVVTGEAEERPDAELRPVGLPAGWSWRARPPLMELAGLLAGATIYVGNDSGVTHLAAASGAPAVAIFRSEHATLWRPYGRVRLIDAESVEMIPVASVLSAIGSLIPGF